MFLVRKDLIFKLLLVLIVVMLLVNGYTLFLFVRGISESEGLGPYYGQLDLLNDDYIFKDPTVPSIRFKSGVKDDLLNILVPSHSSQQMTMIAQKIRSNFLKRIKKRSATKSVQSVNRLSRILKKSTLHKGEEEGPIWKSISGWPFSDSLRLISLGQALRLANHAPITEAKNSERGTQLKVHLTLKGGQEAFFKPQWYPRGVTINGTAYSGKDRHFGEVASFYLNLILGYNNGPVTVARKVGLQEEILPVATYDLEKTFFKTHNGSLCFYGSCYFCKKEVPVCAQGDEIEGALVLLLDRKFKTLQNPWRRTYKVGTPAPWETSMEFCQGVYKEKSLSKRLESILDIVGVSVFDFLIGNGDRHHFEMFLRTDPSSTSHSNRILLIDNGKSFGNSEEDYLDILAPLFQCCKIREGLVSTLNKFEGVLGKSLDYISKVDPLHPFLGPGHLRALDRRLSIVLATVQFCVDSQEENKKRRKVIY